MTSFSNIDPELRVLLQEVADDPKARLFRTDIPRPERLVLTGVPHTGLRAAGLTNAEREILRVYREDVAKILRDAAEWKIQQDPLGAATSSRYSDPYVPKQIPQRGELLDSLRARTERVRRHRPETGVLDSARTGEGLLVGSSTNAHQLAGLSLRLVPHDTGWVHIGRALILEGQTRAALHCLSGVVRRGQSARMQASALTYIGTIYGRARMQEDAAVAYSIASRLFDSDLNCLLSSLVQACFSGHGAMTLRAAEQVDHKLRPDSPGISQWLEEYERRRELGAESWPSSDPHLLAREIADSVGPTTRRVLDEL